MTSTLSVGAAAAVIGVEAHVLRHWEDVGVLIPDRTATGHRRYSDEHVARARIIRLCQGAGLSLADIRELGGADRVRQIGLIEHSRERIRADLATLQRADQFLSHVVQCIHPMVSECPDCAAFARSAPR
ncbi:MerR family copper efflux transcriptional regulator [Mycobacterium sp. MAA66]|jgi:MerR family copper efflux transcriptional regulator|uniref:MerR family transcriptional regulator n=1 Tax=Mycobacterium sp. MAA66 TaxID=3156297 RepID=UPI0035136FD5